MTTHYSASRDANLNVVYTDTDGNGYTFSSGDISLMLTATSLVMLMSLGLGFFYSGLLQRRNALSMLLIVFAIFSAITIEWITVGFTLVYSPGSSFIGDFKHFGLIDTYARPFPEAPQIPSLLFALYQLTFALITPAIAFPAAAERGSISGVLVLAFLWSLIIYNPIAHAVWSHNGFLNRLGDLDYAGGGPVHASSGFAALAFSWWLGRRRDYGSPTAATYRPSSVSNVCLGTILLVTGWVVGFNGGSAGAANLRAVQASLSSIVAASAGGLTWLFLDYRLQRKFSAVALCSGIVSGLVSITPCSGHVGSPSAIAIGAIGTLVANAATRLKFLLKIDETLDIFAVHAGAGVTGSLLNGIFADARIAALDSSVIQGGFINGHYIQLAYQMAGVAYIAAYSFVGTLILCALIDFCPGLRLRVSDQEEVDSIDATQIGESAMDLEHIQPPSYTDTSSFPLSPRRRNSIQFSRTIEDEVELSRIKTERSDV